MSSFGGPEKDTGATGPAGPTGPAGVGTAGGILMFSGLDISATTTDRWLNVPGTNPVPYVLLTTAIEQATPQAMTLKNLFIVHGVVGSGGTGVTYTVFKNGLATSLVVTIAASATSGSNIIDTVTVAKGDKISMKITKPTALTTSPNRVVATMEIQ